VRLLFVVQRYGAEVAGGAEAACRELSTRLAARGHDVHVLTSCALNYLDWADAYPPGDGELDGVLLHRLTARRLRDERVFGPLTGRALYGHRPTPLFLQQEWMRQQGPDLAGLDAWLTERAGGFDVTVFVSYLYATTWRGLPVAAGPAPTVLLPAAHDEAPLWLPLFDLLLRIPTAFAFLTEEEGELIGRRCRVRRPSGLVGLGVELDAAGEGARFRARHALGDRPYLLYVGRLDPSKGSDELAEYFLTYKARNPSPLALVVMGEPVKPLPDHPDVIATGFVPDQERTDAIDGCTALVMPSYYESFSLVLAEAWAQSRPALVNGRSDVLAGQARRSGGAVPYAGYAEFEAAVDLLTSRPTVGPELGARGRRYVTSRYRWDDVLDRTEQLLDHAVRLHRRATAGVDGAPVATRGRTDGRGAPLAGSATRRGR